MDIYLRELRLSNLKAARATLLRLKGLLMRLDSLTYGGLR
jgi:hypothetical protein